MRLIAALASAALALPLLAVAANPQAGADFVDVKGQALGKATLEGGPNGTLITIDLKGLPPGPKAIHIHGMGHCDDGAAGFKHSGGHLNPNSSKHGFLNPEGPDAGDLPNFFVHADGTAWAQFFAHGVNLNGEQSGHILDDDGAALVIHANQDDHQSQPIGGAGDRIACAVIKGK